MTEKKAVKPREVPSRDSKYMGLAWIFASFSKDPNTQVGSSIVSEGNYLLGCGYNGPPRNVADNEVEWSRPSPEEPDAFSKYDLMIHAEANAIDHSRCNGYLEDATLYVTALPCPECMRYIVRQKISRVVYMDYQSSASSTLQNAKWRDKSFEIAKRGNVDVEKFQGSIRWLQDWVAKMKTMGIFEMQ